MPECRTCGIISIHPICPYCKTRLYQTDRTCPSCLRRALPACPNCRTPYSYHDIRTTPRRRQSGGCFIATAAYGTPMAEEINILRQWRDHSLLSWPLGKKIVSCYYRISPSIAKWISKYYVLRNLTRFLLSPIITSIRRFSKYDIYQ